MHLTRGARAAPVAVATILIWAGGAAAQMEGKIINRPLTPQEIVEYGLPEGMQTSAGLQTVGVGASVYLEVLTDKGIGFDSVSWELTTAPDGSGATLQPSPLGSDIGIYSPGDAQVYAIAGRQLLVPGVIGQYTVTATVVTDSGTVTPSITITAANYVGVGTVAGSDPQFPQCALCHADKAAEWLQTRHASKLERELDGLGSSHYNEGCISCHTVGFDPTPAAVNGGFDDVMAATGWEFPTVTDDDGQVHADLKAGNFAAMPAELQALANIQCENCHGPGSEHAGDPKKISISLDAGDCAQCHDDLPYHKNNLEWAASGHAVATRYPTGEGREACVICHSGKGFIDAVEGGYHLTTPGYADQVTDTRWNEISCQVCHDPHSVENPHQLRRVDDVELLNGQVISEGGTGKLCMTCHRSRRDAQVYVQEFHRHYGPHHSNQADMLAGTNAIEYGRTIRSSAHLYAVDDACAGCHMQGVGRDDPAFTHAGGHSFRMVFDNGTPDDAGDDVDLTGACADCHGPMNSFDIPREDFDGDGTVEGVRTEVSGLMDVLGKALPPLGAPEVEVTEDYDAAQLAAAYNYIFVEDDGSQGIHNPRYAVGILKAAIKDLTGQDIVTAVATSASESVPEVFALDQNYPNPFNPTTDIRYSLPRDATVRLDIYNGLGQRVRTLVNAYHTRGQYTVNWDGRDDQGRRVTAGVYLYTLQAGDFGAQRKMVLLP